MPGHKKIQRAHKHKNRKDPSPAEAPTLKATASIATQSTTSLACDKLKTIAHSSFNFVCDYVTTPAKFFLGNMSKILTPDISSAPTIHTLAKLSAKLKVVDYYDAISKKISGQASPEKRKAIQAAVATTTLILASRIATQYSPWYYSGCLIGSYAVKKLLEEKPKEGISKDTKNQSFPRRLARAYFNRLVISQTIGRLGISATQYAPIYFIAKPLIEHGLDKVTNQVITPAATKLARQAKTRTKKMFKTAYLTSRQLAANSKITKVSRTLM